MPSKRYKKALEAVDAKKVYPLKAAVEVLARFPKAKFNETVDLAFRLGVDPKQSDQMVRGTVPLPHGSGKTVKVLVFAKSGPSADAAKAAGAEYVGGTVAALAQGTPVAIDIADQRYLALYARKIQLRVPYAKINLLPEGIAQVRTVNIVGLDLQADGGTHVANTREVGHVKLLKTRSKGANNKRIVVGVED